jgi:hypothetical protein
MGFWTRLRKFWKNLNDGLEEINRSPPSKYDSPPSHGEGPECSRCGRELKFMGNLHKGNLRAGYEVVRLTNAGIQSGAAPSVDQWYGNVCLACKTMFCYDCYEVGAFPCPDCQNITVPAFRNNLERIGVRVQ